MKERSNELALQLSYAVVRLEKNDLGTIPIDIEQNRKDLESLKTDLADKYIELNDTLLLQTSGAEAICKKRFDNVKTEV